MKAVILAAGKGVRMLPLTETRPKVMVDVSGKPFLHYVVENLRRAGIGELAVIVGYRQDVIRDYFYNQKIKATFIEQQEQRGTGHAIRQAAAFCGQEPFLVVSGDNYFSVDDIKAMQQADHYQYVLARTAEDPSKYGVLVERNDVLELIIEKPSAYVGNLVNCGLYKFTPEIWGALSTITLSPRGEYELTDAISHLAQHKKVRIVRIKGHWQDLGCSEDIPQMERLLGLEREF